jgi:hypothetical protein
MLDPGARPKRTHIFAKEAGLHYVEPQWCSIRLFEVEQFSGLIWDPFAGWGRIVEAARAAGYATRATDIADRGYAQLDGIQDFLKVDLSRLITSTATHRSSAIRPSPMRSCSTRSGSTQSRWRSSGPSPGSLRRGLGSPKRRSPMCG